MKQFYKAIQLVYYNKDEYHISMYLKLGYSYAGSMVPWIKL
jgi:hypothetical protein